MRRKNSTGPAVQASKQNCEVSIKKKKQRQRTYREGPSHKEEELEAKTRPTERPTRRRLESTHCEAGHVAKRTGRTALGQRAMDHTLDWKMLSVSPAVKPSTHSCAHTHTHTHTHTHNCKTNRHNAVSECQCPRRLERPTRQSMFAANRRLSAFNGDRQGGARIVGDASWSRRISGRPLPGALYQKPVQNKRRPDSPSGTPG